MSGNQLVAFLRARYDELQAQQEDVFAAWHSPDCESVPDGWGRETGACNCGVPAQVLRDVEAKRLLLEQAVTSRHHISADQYETCPRATAADGLDTITLGALEELNEERRQEDGVEPECWESCGRDARVRRTLELLALPYSDHPGYEEAWRP
ncbi:DUF6221 family protein [Streptomyces rhizosphaericola]|uniref:DUF6221 family protein n=1 Tax=Streptomyces rhizosphaericola TaxID=2564098 RepID=UPI0036C45826